MAEFELYCFAQSGNAYKAALMLNLAGADWTPRFVDYFKGETRTPEYRRDVNVMGEVPVLVHRGKKLSQSGAILTYLADRLGKFGGDAADERYEVLRWLLFDNHKFTSYLGTRRFFIAFMKTGETPVTEFLGQRMKTALGVLESQLDGRDFVLGKRPTIADISLCGYLYYPEIYGFDRAELPRIAKWLDRIAALPGWKHPYDLMPGHPLPA